MTVSGRLGISRASTCVGSGATLPRGAQDTAAADRLGGATHPVLLARWRNGRGCRISVACSSRGGTHCVHSNSVPPIGLGTCWNFLQLALGPVETLNPEPEAL